jgi:hypothetical protein
MRNMRKRRKAAEEEADAEEENQSTGSDVEMQDSATSTLPVSDDEDAKKLLQDFKNMLKDMKQSFERVKSEAKKHYIEMTSADADGEWHRAPVCVVCDRFIIEFDNITWVKKEVLLKHVHRLGRHAFEVHNAMVLPDSLKKQYMVEDDELKHLLLSPRARRREDDGSYMCCKQCSDSLRDHMLKSSSPPRHAIANELVIGCIPEDILSEEEITDVLAAMLATVRPFIHVVSFSGGQSKTMKGTVTFFQNNVSHTGSVLDNYLKTGANPNVYCVMCGRFTPNQREIARKKMMLNVNVFKRVIKWFIEETEHAAYSELDPDMRNWPAPTIVGANETANNTDKEEDADLEATVEGSRYYFPSGHEPNEDCATFETQAEFAKSMLNGTTPTLLFHPGNYECDRDIPIENMFPLVFPYGIGGFEMKKGRRNKLSIESLIDHYFHLSLPQFHRPDFILVLFSMLMRRRAFSSGVIKCKTKERGETLGTLFSKLTPDAVALAANRANVNMRTPGLAGRFLSSVTTSCRPLGHSNEAAVFARKQYMAYCDMLGIPGVFFSVTPDDSMSFRIKVFVSSGKEVKLPSLDWSDEECILDLRLREKIRMSYPGVCSLEFQSVMDFVWKHIIGWDRNEQKATMGIFGIPIAACEADEEQGRKTLHSHWLIWLQYFNSIRHMCYNQNLQLRTQFREAVKNFAKKIMCATYGSKFEVSHVCKENTITEEVSDAFESVDNQIVRDARHKDHCFDIQGKMNFCSCEFLFL